MRYPPPKRWSEITPGAMIMDHSGVARRVLDVGPSVAGRRTAYIEGLPITTVIDYHFIAVVEFDESDAIGNMLRAGFTVKPIKE